MFCLPGGALCAPASMRTAAVHPARSGERVTKSQTGIGLSRPGLAALNNRRCCPSDSWLQRGNICLKTCTPFTAGFMPEIAVLCVNKLAAGARMVACCRPRSKKIYKYLYDANFGGMLLRQIFFACPWLSCVRKAAAEQVGHRIIF